MSKVRGVLDDPLLSVVMPAYNEAATIDEIIGGITGESEAPLTYKLKCPVLVIETAVHHPWQVFDQCRKKSMTVRQHIIGTATLNFGRGMYSLLPCWR